MMVRAAVAGLGGGPHSARAGLAASVPLLLGVVLAALVCYPFVGGRLLLLDFVSGPHQPLLPAAAFGLDGGLTGGVPLAIGFHLLNRFLGQAGSIVPAAVFFPLATTGAARLVRAEVLPARLGAGLFYAVNPFVFDRLYAGQFGLLLGYALLPFAVTALLDAAQESHRVGRAACWAGATVMMSEHFALILVPVTAAIVVTRPRRLRASLRLGGAALGAAAISSYLLVPPLLTGANPAGAFAQLTSYRTRADPRVGLLVNVAGLYGFFRPGPTEPKDLFSRWPAILAALVLIVAVGYVVVLRDGARRRNGLVFVAAGIAGYFLALGDQGPTGDMFRLAYEHVPGFVMMREPDKFAVLVPLAYAYGFGWGIAWLTSGSRKKASQVVPAALALALPLAYTPNLLAGLGGQVKASDLPSSWSSASRLAGQAPVLFLPWHEYFPTPFTGERAIANPAVSYFAGTVLTSQNPGPCYAFAAADPEHVFLDKLLGPPVDLQRLHVALAGLGVRFVVLAKVADWRDFARVAVAPGIRLAYSSPSVALFSVRPTATETHGARRVRSVDLVDYRVLPGRPGVVALPVPYSRGWTLDGHPDLQLADGQAGIFAPAAGGVAHYAPSDGVIASEIGSLVAALAVAVVAFVERRRRLIRRFGVSVRMSAAGRGPCASCGRESLNHSRPAGVLTVMAKTSSVPYNDAFFRIQAAKSSNSAAVVVPIVDELVHPSSVLDVGCGVGAWLAEWKNRGARDVVGLDGAYVDRSRLLIDPSNLRTANLEQPFRLDRQFDLVECLEVAEHLDESCADALVDSIAQHSDTVLFGAAVPSQGGTHHVNEQWPSYWISKFARLDFQAFDVIRPRIWTNPTVQVWYRQNIVLFSRTRSFGEATPVLDVVHPELWRASHGNAALRLLVRMVPTAIRARAIARFSPVGAPEKAS